MCVEDPFSQIRSHIGFFFANSIKIGKLASCKVLMLSVSCHLGNVHKCHVS